MDAIDSAKTWWLILKTLLDNKKFIASPNPFIKVNM